jgi:hypothetical protein
VSVAVDSAISYAEHLPGEKKSLLGLVTTTGRSQLVIVKHSRPKLGLVLAAELIRRRRRLMLIEFQPRKSRIWWMAFGPLLRRTVVAAQVLSSFEIALGQERLPRADIACIPWFWRQDEPAPGQRLRSGVVASGRACCDWPTLLEAAEPAWTLTVVCAGADEATVRALADRSVSVLVDIQPAEHRRLLENAAVYVVSLREDGVSCGQVRLAEAATAGVPVVVSDVAGIRDYITPVTHVIVRPGDVAQLREAVAIVLAGNDGLARLAHERASQRLPTDYLADLRALVSRHLH